MIPTNSTRWVLSRGDKTVVGQASRLPSVLGPSRLKNTSRDGCPTSVRPVCNWQMRLAHFRNARTCHGAYHFAAPASCKLAARWCGRREY